MTNRSDDEALDLAFPAHYRVRLLGESPGASVHRWDFARGGRVVDDGVLIEVITERRAPWIGLVANGPESVAAAHTGVYSTPSVATLCVVARGDAFFIEAAAPENWWVLDQSPIVAVRSAVDEALLLLATP